MQKLHTKVLLLFHFRSCDEAAESSLWGRLLAGGGMDQIAQKDVDGL
ncbi:hypothetical protein MES5069_250093 [Mesorhizobium escarrei]|uniref:Uncharacterized protein n=1 Tax=Mesorhizobium escarrei TaxID=666018 RepID=A0ABM9DUF2_9HYPH|nr:hypothetical protein MES5069_250093 [Mesorhizobium escarrei]